MSETGTEARIRAVIEGDVQGQLAIGENIVQIGSMQGGIVDAGNRPVRPSGRAASPALS